MPLYKYVGNRILTGVENKALGLNLTEFHSGYRAYDLHALGEMDFSRMTNDFHFDTEIIIKLQHQRFRIKEVPIPTYYGAEICYVNGMKYAKDVVRAISRYKQTVRSVERHPEFREYFVHYPIKQSKYSSHYYAQKFTGANREVLDVGCGEGFLAVELAKSGNRVTGVDALKAASQVAALAAYYDADLDASIAPVLAQLGGKTFDRLLLLDVLEHLRDPGRLLRECRVTLKPNGMAVVSVPNVANITVRLLLLFGLFPYTERGILDKTHLRFFTRRSARELIENNGYEVVEQKSTVMPLELVLGLSPNNWLMKSINLTLGLFTKFLPGLLGYQTVFLARKSPDESSS